MNRKQFTILIVLVVVLGGAGLVLYNNQSSSFRSSGEGTGQKLLGDFPVNDVTHIAIRQGGEELNLVKKDDLWRVRERYDYPADFREISQLLLKLREMKIVQSEQVGPSQLPRLELTTGEGPNSATVLEFKGQGDKPLKTLLLGKKHLRKSQSPSPFGGMDDEGWPDGRYVKAGADSDSVALVSDPLSNVEPKPAQWLSKDFLRVEKARAVAVAFPEESHSWALSRDTEFGEWKLADAKSEEQLDPSKASSVSNPMSSASFVDVLAPEPPSEKSAVVTIETFDNFTYTLHVGMKTEENYPLSVSVAAQLAKERAPGESESPEDKERLDKEFAERQQKLKEKLAQEKAFEKWTYLVSGWTLDSLLKPRAELLAEKQDETAETDTDDERQKTVQVPGHEGHDH